MKTSKLLQSTMTPEVSRTYDAVRRVAIHPPQDPNELIERVLQAIWYHPEQLEELAGRWHRRVVKMRRQERVRAEWEDWLREKGGRTEVHITLMTSNLVIDSIKGFVYIYTHNPATVATIVQEHGGTHYPEHSCWLLDQGVDVDRWVSHIEDMLAAMPQPTYSVVSGRVDSEFDEHGSALSLSEALTTASHLFAAHQERRIKDGLPRLHRQFNSLDDSDGTIRNEGRVEGWGWLFDADESVRNDNDNDWRLGEDVLILRDDPSNAVA